MKNNNVIPEPKQTPDPNTSPEPAQTPEPAEAPIYDPNEDPKLDPQSSIS